MLVPRASWTPENPKILAKGRIADKQLAIGGADEVAGQIILE